MNPNKSHHRKRALKPIVFALALAMPGAAVVAASMGDVVKTRADQTIDQQYGRDSVYAFSPESKALSPDRTFGSQTQSSGSGGLTALQGAPNTATGNVGSGYVDGQSDAIANVGSGYVGMENEDVILIPLMSASDDETALQFDRGYYQEPDQIVVMLPYDDDTAHQYDRGYYQDPDQVAVFIIQPDVTALQADESASVSGSNVAVAD